MRLSLQMTKESEYIVKVELHYTPKFRFPDVTSINKD